MNVSRSETKCKPIETFWCWCLLGGVSSLVTQKVCEGTTCRIHFSCTSMQHLARKEGYLPQVTAYIWQRIEWSWHGHAVACMCNFIAQLSSLGIPLKHCVHNEFAVYQVWGGHASTWMTRVQYFGGYGWRKLSNLYRNCMKYHCWIMELKLLSAISFFLVWFKVCIHGLSQSPQVNAGIVP